jgi:RNA polymerase sigma factor FliA
MREMSEAIFKVEQRNQKQATTNEIVAELGISSEEYFKLVQDINYCYVLSLDDIDRDNSIFGDDSASPHEVHHQEMDKEYLKTILTKLPEKEQLVLSLYYVEEFTFKQIGEILELTEARICQLHTQAIARIRAKMGSSSSVTEKK